MDKKICFSKESNRLILYHPYDMNFITFVKTIPGRMYEPIGHTWSLPNQRTLIEKVAQVISIFLLQIDESLKESAFCDFVLTETELNKSPIDISEERYQQLSSLLVDLQCLRQPRRYQLAGVDLMLQRIESFNGDDMGLGKTGQAILTIELSNSFPCLVICPASVKYNWKREWHRWFSHREVLVVDEPFNSKQYSDVVSINYDRVAKNKDELKKVPWESIICDESHYLKNNKALRSKAVSSLRRKIERRIFLTGTASQNRPSELVNQLVLLGVFDRLFGDWKKFILRYCNAKETNYGWDYSGASNIVELNMILRRSVYIRREKREVLHELPPIQHSVMEVEVDNMKEYKSAESDLLNYLKENVSYTASINAAYAQQLVLLNILRKLSAKGKLQAIFDFIEDFIEGSDRKLLVFGIHVDIVDAIANKFGWDRVNGSTPTKDRMEIVQRFASSKKRGLVGNIQSLGTGVDGLQDNCSDVLITELPDRPADIDQAISRLERIGVKNAISVYYLLAQKTIDMNLWDSLQQKKRVVDGVNKGIIVEENFSVIKDVLKSYLKSI